MEAVLDEPLADEFLGELLLLFTTLEALFVAFGIEVAGGVGRVDLVDEVNLAVLLPEFVLRVDEDQATLTCHLLTTLEESVGVGLEQLVVFFADQTGADDLLAGDILVMADIFLRGGGDDGRGEGFVLTHTVGELDTAEGAFACLISTPSRAGEVATDDHLYTEGLTAQAERYHGVGSGDEPVGDDVARSFEEVGRDLVEDLSLVGDALGEYDVEGGDAVGGDHRYLLATEEVHVADLAMIDVILMGKLEVRADECLCHNSILCD